MSLTYPAKTTRDHSFTQLVEGFKEPALEYCPVLMWFWNDTVTKEGITYQLEKFREQNIISFFIHPANGLTIEYLSDEFFELIKHAVKEAKRLGMKYWIYDELDWPSGVAGGLVLQNHPEYRQKELYCAKRGFSTNDLEGVNGCMDFRGKFICAKRRNTVTGKVTDVTDKCTVTENGEFTSVYYSSSTVTGEEILYFYSRYNVTNTYTAIASPKNRGVYGWLDMMNYDAVTEFINTTHEKYKAAVGDEFGKTVLGVFTDEPGTGYVAHLDDPIRYAWGDEFVAAFEKDHGYSLIPYIQALFYAPVTDMERKVRQDYVDTAARLFQRNFSQQISEWCQKNGLMFTGHYDVEERLSGQSRYGNFQKVMFYMDVPGIDSIYTSKFIENNNYNTAGKMLEAAAKFTNKDRTLCETYTISGTDYSLPEMKRVANRLMTLGVNMIQFMGAHYSNADGRKAFSGSVAGFFNPLLRFYHQFNNYVASVSYLSASTVPQSKVLLFIPSKQHMQTSTVLPGYSNDVTLQRIYEDSVNALLREGIGYDLICDDFADELSVKDGKIEAFGYKYGCAVFPAMEYVQDDMAKLIEQMKQSGIKMIFVDKLPGFNVTTAKKFDAGFEMNPLDEHVMQDENSYLIKADKHPINMKMFRKSLKKIIGKPILGIESDLRFYITERENAAAKVYFISNDDNREGKIYIDSQKGMRIFSADTKQEIVTKVENGRVEISVKPYEMTVIICDKASNEEYKSVKAENLTEIARINPEDAYEFTPLEGNMLPITCEIFNEEINCWCRAENYHFPAGLYLETNQPYKMRANVGLGYIPKELFLNVEVRGMKRLRINGREVDFSVNTIRWSGWDARIDLTKYVRPGNNVIEADVVTESINRTTCPAFMFLSGDFTLSVFADIPDAKTEVIHSGNWAKQGYKFFSGTGIYKTGVTVEKEFKKAELIVDTKDVAEVYINGEYAGRRIWAYENVDITKQLKQGENDIEVRVTSNLGNLLGTPCVNGIMTPIAVKLLG